MSDQIPEWQRVVQFLQDGVGYLRSHSYPFQSDFSLEQLSAQFSNTQFMIQQAQELVQRKMATSKQRLQTANVRYDPPPVFLAGGWGVLFTIPEFSLCM